MIRLEPRQLLTSRCTTVLLALLASSICAQSASAQRTDPVVLERRVVALTQAGNYIEALSSARQLLQVAEIRFGKDDYNTGTVLLRLANILYHLSRYNEAEPLYLRALDNFEKNLGSEHAEVENVGLALAKLYRTTYRFAEAEPLYKRSIARREKALGPKHADVAYSVNGLANFYFDLGRYAEAESLYKRSLAIWEQALGSEHPLVASSLENLANLYSIQTRYAEAEPLYNRVLGIREKALGNGHPDFARTLVGLGALYANQRRFAEAEPLYKRSIVVEEKAFGRDNPAIITSLYNLTKVYAAQGRYAEAESLAKRSLAISDKAFGTDNPRAARSLDALADIDFSQGRYADAEALRKRALVIREKSLGPEHPHVANNSNALGRLELKQQHWSSALSLFRRAAAIQSARLLRAARDDQASASEIEPFYNQTSAAWALSVEQPARRDELTSESFEAAQWAVRESIGSALSQMAARFGAGSSTLALQTRERQDLVRQREQIDRTLIAAVSEPPNRRDEAGIGELRRKLAAVEEKLSALAQALEREFPNYAELTSPKPLGLRDVQRLLSADEALVVFLPEGEDETFVWAVTRDSSSWQRIPLDDKALGQKVASLRKGLDQEDLEKAAKAGTLFDLGLAQELYAVLLAPVVDVLKDKRHLMIVPSGSLTSLPFQVLVTETAATPKPDAKQLDTYREAAWLIKRHALTVLPSVSSLKALRVLAGGSQSTRPLVGYGDPIFSRVPAVAAGQLDQKAAGASATRTRGYASYFSGARPDLRRLSEGLLPLPETARELKAVAKRLGVPESDIHLGAEATEAAVKRADLSPYRVVYFATHGLVGGEVKGLAEPALVLTLPPEATDLDDGLLTASEVAQLKLNADWVVLSACNTAAGDRPGAEALSGLARAFFYAGARALLVSHWRVDSEAATRLTTSTFETLQKDQRIGRAEALRRAMLAYMNDTSSPWNAYPDYWGPFSIVGEGGPQGAVGRD